MEETIKQLRDEILSHLQKEVCFFFLLGFIKETYPLLSYYGTFLSEILIYDIVMFS